MAKSNALAWVHFPRKPISPSPPVLAGRAPAWHQVVHVIVGLASAAAAPSTSESRDAGALALRAWALPRISR